MRRGSISDKTTDDFETTQTFNFFSWFKRFTENKKLHGKKETILKYVRM